MAVLIPRTRTIGVRLSEEEYANVSKFCAQNGARSIADLARQAIHIFMSNANRETAAVSVESARDKHVKRLEEEIAKLSAEMAALNDDKKRGAGD
jgi:hypothetical protein